MAADALVAVPRASDGTVEAASVVEDSSDAFADALDALAVAGTRTSSAHIAEGSVAS